MNTENTRIGLETCDGATAPALKSVHVNGRLDGLLLDMRIRQHYRNESAQNIEAVYTFPLAWGARLMGLDVTIAGKKLSGSVVERKQAQRNYENAIEDGDTPVMVEQSSAGLFTANLGNIKPGEDVILELRYAQLLRFEQGRVRLAVPTVIAPRYGDAHQPGALAPHETDATSFAADYPLTLNIDLIGDIAGAQISSPSHPVCVREIAGGRAVSLAGNAVLDRDFVLVLENLAAASFAISAPDSTGGKASPMHTVLASFCPALPSQNAPLLLKILVDCSGSMAGDSIRSAKQALHGILAELNEGDYVSFSRFGNNVQHDQPRLEPCATKTIRRLSNAIASTEADLGGTEMQPALLSTFKDIAAPENTELPPPVVLLITDGEVWAVEDVVSEAKRSGHRIFAVGVGGSPAESLLRNLAMDTGGACELVSPNEDIGGAIVRMFRRMRGATAVRACVNWGEGVRPLWQSALPAALYDGETVHLFAQFAKLPEHAPELLWEIAGEPRALRAKSFSKNAEIPDDNLPRLAGAQKMNEAESAGEKTALALRYQLVSEHTNLFLVHIREDKATGLPVLQQVPQMLATGWGMVVEMDNDICYEACYSLDASPLPRRVRLERHSKIAFAKPSGAPPNCLHPSPPPAACLLPDGVARSPGNAKLTKKSALHEQAPSQCASTSPDILILLKKFDELARQTTDFAAIIAQLPDDALEVIATLISTSARLSDDEREQRWAVLLEWLLEQNKEHFTPSRQATRLLRQRLKIVPRKIRKTITDLLAGLFS
jgi:Ca-activated chloride channel family protein